MLGAHFSEVFFVEKYAQSSSVVYDAGCSTGLTTLAIANRLQSQDKVSIIGLDASADMIKKAQSNKEKYLLIAS